MEAKNDRCTKTGKNYFDDGRPYREENYSYTGLSDGNIGLIASLGTFSNNYIIPQTPLSSGIF